MCKCISIWMKYNGSRDASALSSSIRCWAIDHWRRKTKRALKQFTHKIEIIIQFALSSVALHTYTTSTPARKLISWDNWTRNDGNVFHATETNIQFFFFGNNSLVFCFYTSSVCEWCCGWWLSTFLWLH